MSFYGNQHTQNRPGCSHEALVGAARVLGDDLGRSPTTREAVEDDRFPSTATIYRYAEGGWLGVLEDAGLAPTQVREYGADAESRMSRDLRGAFRAVETPYLTHRQYDDLGAYPTSVVKAQFGSWKEACDAAGISAGQKHGTTCTGPKGEQLESFLERAVASALVDLEIEYEVHPAVPETNWEADFYLPGCGLWVEADGYIAGTRPNERGFARKLAYLRERGAEVVVVESEWEIVDELRARGVVGKGVSE